MQLGAEPLRGALEALARRGRLDLGAGVPAERTLAGLTPREVEVLRLLVEGRSNRQIAEQLFISGKTASVHVTNILAKLGVHSRLEAAATARRLGLDQPAPETSASLTAGRPWRGCCRVQGPHHPLVRPAVVPGCGGEAASRPGPEVKALWVGDLRSSPQDWLAPLPLASGVEHPHGQGEHRMSA